jgi:hypothetical protein
VDPVPDPLRFFFGSAGNRTQASGSVAKNSALDHRDGQGDSFTFLNLLLFTNTADCGSNVWQCLPFSKTLLQQPWTAVYYR